MSRSMPFAFLAGSLALSLAACATPPAEDPAPTAPGEPIADSCKAEAAQSTVGKPATTDVVEQARKAAGADVARTLKPGQMVTMEYRAGRLNIDVDEKNVIVAVRCG